MDTKEPASGSSKPFLEVSSEPDRPLPFGYKKGHFWQLRSAYFPPSSLKIFAIPSPTDSNPVFA